MERGFPSKPRFAEPRLGFDQERRTVALEGAVDRIADRSDVLRTPYGLRAEDIRMRHVATRLGRQVRDRVQPVDDLCRARRSR